MQAFLADTAPDAYERLIDRLLESPHYGERWGRHWLDVAGYADSDGYSDADPPRAHAYKYRDYVIGSFNSDKPFDRFITEQLAGDELARATRDNPQSALLTPHTRELLIANQAKFLGWCSELDEQQLGALFVSKKMLDGRRGVAEKFVKAYRRGVSDYAAALLRLDRTSKRTSDIKSKETATVIARYVYPDRGTDAAAAVELGAYYIDPQARLDVADIARQVAWYKSRGLIDKSIDARNVVDASFVK